MVGFAYDERTRMRKELNYADVYHSANRYGSGKEQVPIVLPRSQLYSFLRGRLVLGRESLRLQGHGWDPRHLMLYSESNLQDLAGNSFLVVTLAPQPFHLTNSTFVLLQAAAGSSKPKSRSRWFLLFIVM